MVAHAEVGLVSSSGYKGCRRCEVEAKYIDNHCRFGNFQQKYTTPAEPRSAVNNRKSGKDADCAPNPTQRKALTKATGVTGETIVQTICALASEKRPYR